MSPEEQPPQFQPEKPLELRLESATLLLKRAGFYLEEQQANLFKLLENAGNASSDEERSLIIELLNHEREHTTYLMDAFRDAELLMIRLRYELQLKNAVIDYTIAQEDGKTFIAAMESLDTKIRELEEHIFKKGPEMNPELEEMITLRSLLDSTFGNDVAERLKTLSEEMRALYAILNGDPPANEQE